MVTITAQAAKKIKEILKQEDKKFLRVAVQGGGCSGFQYNLLVDESPSESDELIECEGIKILIDPISKRYIRGSEIDFDASGILEGGFKIKNPNAKSTCGCGQSFQA